MSESLIKTKLTIPPLRTGLVPRPRLTRKLDRALECKLTLVIAPAGFGKTTLLRVWIADLPQPVGWLSLDEGDDRSRRFLLYLIQAFRALDPGIGAASLALLNSAHTPEMTAVLVPLSNDLAALEEDCVLILDDYHLVEDPDIQAAIVFLLNHLPSQIHLVVASRTEPPINLARMRGQAQLLEFTTADLRFTAVEADDFLNGVMQLGLSPAERTTLEMQTEGWITGLQLAALSLQTQADKSAFIAAFAGTNRYVADYLFEEVLNRQSNEIREFLLSTAIVESICGDLADALLEGTVSQQILESLEKAQLFINALDDKRQWYRYHPLFAGLLHQRLSQTHPEKLPKLHRRASLWFEGQGRLEEAIQHGLEAQDFERTAGLIEEAFQRRDWIGRDMKRLLMWFETLPEAIVLSRPALLLGYSWLLLEIQADPWQTIEKQLHHIEDILTSQAVHSDQEAHLFLAQVDLLRANRARDAGEPDRVIDLCRQALGRLPEDETYIRSGTMAHLASAYESLGQLEQASDTYEASIRLCQTSVNVDGLLFAAARLLELLPATGQLSQAESLFEEVRRFTDERSGPDVGLVYIAIGDVYREQNRLDLARTYLERGIELCRPFAAWRAGLNAGVIALARLQAAEGHEDEALKTLSELDKRLSNKKLEENIKIAAVRTRLLLAQGHYDAAARWATSSGLSARDVVDFPSELAYLTLARVFVAQASLEVQKIPILAISDEPLDDANYLLQSLYRAALSGGRNGRIVEVRMLQALVQAQRKDTTGALERLEEALVLAELEGYVRLFADEGQPLFHLLSILSSKAHSPISPGYLQQILAAFPPSPDRLGQAGIPPGNRLTESEMRTLRLLATERSIKEIAAELSISVSTVRTYSKRIYNKLDAHSRAEAVYRAKELQLL